MPRIFASNIKETEIQGRYSAQLARLPFFSISCIPSPFSSVAHSQNDKKEKNEKAAPTSNIDVVGCDKDVDFVG